MILNRQTPPRAGKAKRFVALPARPALCYAGNQSRTPQPISGERLAALCVVAALTGVVFCVAACVVIDRFNLS